MGGDFEGDFMGNGTEEDQSSRTGGGGKERGGMKNSVEFIKLPIPTTYSNFEDRVRSRTSFLFFSLNASLSLCFLT